MLVLPGPGILGLLFVVALVAGDSERLAKALDPDRKNRKLPPAMHAVTTNRSAQPPPTSSPILLFLGAAAGAVISASRTKSGLCTPLPPPDAT